MAVHLQDIFDYLDVHLARDHADSAASLMQMLHEVYTANYTVDTQKIRDMFRQVSDIVDMLPGENGETLFFLVCDLCMEQERTAFSHGVAVGMQLMSEIRVLP